MDPITSSLHLADYTGVDNLRTLGMYLCVGL